MPETKQPILSLRTVHIPLAKYDNSPLKPRTWQSVVMSTTPPSTAPTGSQGQHQPPQSLQIPNNHPQRQTSANSNASADSTALPPFPPSGASPDTRSPPPAHPDAEAFLNAAAQHVFPEQPAPQRSEDDEKKGVTHEGRISPSDRDGSKRAQEGKKREEKPLLVGTPLDEMTPLKTPGALSGGQAGFPFPPKRTASSGTITQANREDSGDTLNAAGARSGIIGAIPENEQLQTDVPQEMDSAPASAVSKRPDLRAHDYGSVGRDISTLGRRVVRSVLTRSFPAVILRFIPATAFLFCYDDMTNVS